MSNVIPNGAEGPVRDLTTFASFRAANGTVPAACARLFAGRNFLQ